MPDGSFRRKKTKTCLPSKTIDVLTPQKKKREDTRRTSRTLSDGFFLFSGLSRLCRICDALTPRKWLSDLHRRGGLRDTSARAKRGSQSRMDRSKDVKNGGGGVGSETWSEDRSGDLWGWGLRTDQSIHLGLVRRPSPNRPKSKCESTFRRFSVRRSITISPIRRTDLSKSQGPS